MSKQQQQIPEILVELQEQQDQQNQQSNAFLLGFLAGLTPEHGRLGANQSPDAWTKNLVDQMLNSYATADLEALGQQGVGGPHDVYHPLLVILSVCFHPLQVVQEEVLPPVIGGPVGSSPVVVAQKRFTRNR